MQAEILFHSRTLKSRLFLFIIYKMLTCTIYLPYHLDEYQEQEISEGCNLVDIFYSKGFIIFSWNSNLSNLERTLNSPLLCYEESLNSCIYNIYKWRPHLTINVELREWKTGYRGKRKWCSNCSLVVPTKYRIQKSSRCVASVHSNRSNPRYFLQETF